MSPRRSSLKKEDGPLSSENFPKVTMGDITPPSGDGLGGTGDGGAPSLGDLALSTPGTAHRLAEELFKFSPSAPEWITRTDITDAERLNILGMLALDLNLSKGYTDWGLVTWMDMGLRLSRDHLATKNFLKAIGAEMRQMAMRARFPFQGGVSRMAGNNGGYGGGAGLP